MTQRGCLPRPDYAEFVTKLIESALQFARLLLQLSIEKRNDLLMKTPKVIERQLRSVALFPPPGT